MIDQENAAKAAVEKMVASFLEQHEVCAIRVFFVMNGAGRVTSQDVGRGDIYSMQGAVREWLIIQDERARAIVWREEKEGEG